MRVVNDSGRFTPRRETRYALYRSLGGPQGRSERVRKNLTFTGIGSQHHQARSKSLYRLRHPGPYILILSFIFTPTECPNNLFPSYISLLPYTGHNPSPSNLPSRLIDLQMVAGVSQKFSTSVFKANSVPIYTASHPRILESLEQRTFQHCRH
jgi:hypothetical protein